MTITELIHKLENMRATLGPNAPVKAWHLGREAITSLEIRRVDGVTAGWDKEKKMPTAVLNIR